MYNISESMASKSEQRKQAKRKKRQAAVRKKQHQERESRARRNQFENNFFRENKEAFKAKDRLEGEILLEAVGLPVDKASIPKAVAFIASCKAISDKDRLLSRGLDGLFSAVHEKDISRRYNGMGRTQVIGFIIKEMRATLGDYEANTELLFGTEIGQKVYATDDLGTKIVESCEARRDEIISLDRQFKTAIDISEPGDECDDNITLAVAADGLASAVTDPIEQMERFRLGVPSDFYNDIVSLISQVSAGSAIFFLRELYCCMQGKDFPMKGIEGGSLVRFSAVMKVSPEKVLPEPGYLRELKEATLRFDSAGGGQAHVRVLSLLRDDGLSAEEAMAKLERLPDHPAVRSVLSSLDAGKLQPLERFLDNPECFDAFQVLCRMGKRPEEALAFLGDYGDYIINGSTIAGVVRDNKCNKALVDLIFRNGLYLCCDEASSDMIEAMKDAERGAWTLNCYIRYGEAGEPFKQLALLRYVHEQGSRGMKQYIEKLDAYEDAEVGELLQEDACISMVLAGYKPARMEPSHRFREMENFDLVMQYNMAPDLNGLDQPQLKQCDAFISAVRGTRCEHALLGQPSLRHRALERLLHGELSIDDIPDDGDIYHLLKEGKPAAQKSEEVRMFERIILVSDRVDQATADYLQGETGCEVNLLSVTSSAHRFSGIREGDMVLYDTTKTGHSTYYIVKNLAYRRGAAFRHASRTNKDALLELILQ